MVGLGAIGFAAPAVLAALIALPVLWWLLRAVPPAPLRRRFPGIALLLGLRERDPESQRTPWWLLALRMTALAALILALAGPVLNPRTDSPGEGPLLVVMDASWASARDWPRRAERVSRALTDARRAGRPVALVRLTDPPSGGALAFRGAEHWQERLAGLQPRPVAPGAELPDWLESLPDTFETLWISDGLAREGRSAMLAELQARGPVRVFQTDTPVLALLPARFEGGSVTVPARRAGEALPAAQAHVIAIGRDPAGTERELARAPLAFATRADSAEAVFSLQPELRNRITRFQIEGARGPASVSLADDSLRRRKVALLSVREGTEALALLTPLHFVRQALAPSTDLVEGGGIEDLLLAAPDVVVLSDAPGLSDSERLALTEWVEQGGLLLRFAGPRLAAGPEERSAEQPFGAALDDPLLPVTLRAGGRTVGGAMSWGAPRLLAPFREGTPFAGLAVPDEVTVRAQVLAQPGPDLSERSIAELADGTPLVTRRALGEGQVVLFHVTAGADWSSLPLSGLFVRMLERLAVSTRGQLPDSAELADSLWQQEARLDGFGRLQRAEDSPAVPGPALREALDAAEPQPGAPVPGLYSGGAQRVALNVAGPRTRPQPASWPSGVVLESGIERPEQPLAGWFFSAAALALMADALATLALAGRLGAGPVGAALLALALVPLAEAPARAETSASSRQPVDERLLQATESVVLAHVSSGDERVDEIAHAGLRGLSEALFTRTSVEPGTPMRVDVESDELALFPFLYWPVVEESPIPTPEGYARINRYLRGGGLILFDTRDAERAELTGTTPAARRLQAIAAGLDIPPLEPVPNDHVLTRTFFLLGDFPGRYSGSQVWVEAAPPEAERAEGMPFRNLNDGVTPVVIGGNDWAAAWAVDERGLPLVPIGRGMTGERQREMAMRFGINLIMHVLSGNYKSDQVHVPALLERLGQ
ncbi:MAG: DUF4159 domain-containing protein [Pararhodobacter sp.]|nr:DUF4159 domain-containing protein [Pararhodobacter sp.]